MSPSGTRSFWPLPSRPVALRLVMIGGGLLIVGFALALFIAHHKAWMNATDLPVNRWLYDLGRHQVVLRDPSRLVSYIGGGSKTLPLMLGVAAILVVCRRWRWALFLVVCSQGGFFVSNTTKHLVERSRPPFGHFTGSQVGTSFPSGHTFAGISTWLAIAVIVFYVLPRPWSTWGAIFPVIIGVANGPSRLVLGQHWITDVLGAWLLGGGWLLVCFGLFVRFVAVPSSDPDHSAQPNAGGSPPVDLPATQE